MVGSHQGIDAKTIALTLSLAAIDLGDVDNGRGERVAELAAEAAAHAQTLTARALRT